MTRGSESLLPQSGHMWWRAATRRFSVRFTVVVVLLTLIVVPARPGVAWRQCVLLAISGISAYQ